MEINIDNISKINNININNKNEEINLDSLVLINNNLRANILLSLAIFKNINNFDHNYIHYKYNDNIKKSI